MSETNKSREFTVTNVYFDKLTRSQGYRKLADEKDKLNVDKLIRLTRIVKYLKPHIEAYQESREAILKKLGTPSAQGGYIFLKKDADGKPIKDEEGKLIPDMDKQTECLDEIEKLRTMTDPIQLEYAPVSVELKDLHGLLSASEIVDVHDLNIIEVKELMEG